MNRKEQLRSLVSVMTEKEDVINKYVSHLEDVLDVIDPEKIGDAYKKALKASDYATALHVLAARVVCR